MMKDGVAVQRNMLILLKVMQKLCAERNFDAPQQPSPKLWKRYKVGVINLHILTFSAFKMLTAPPEMI